MLLRTTGTYVTTTTLGEAVRAFVPHPLPPAKPPLAAESHEATHHRAEMALARLAGVAGLVPSVDWLLYSAIRKEALLTSQIEGTQASLTDLFDDEAGQVLTNTDDRVGRSPPGFRPANPGKGAVRGGSRTAPTAATPTALASGIGPGCDPFDSNQLTKQAVRAACLP